MKLKLIICFTLILLLLSGCRDLQNKEQKPTGSDTPGAAASEASGKPQESATQPPSLGVTAPTPLESGAAAGTSGADASAIDALVPAYSPSPSGTPAGTQSPDAAASPSGMMASKEDVSATLDDILKELSDLDKLYSQMDNLSESDLK